MMFLSDDAAEKFRSPSTRITRISRPCNVSGNISLAMVSPPAAAPGRYTSTRLSESTATFGRVDLKSTSAAQRAMET